MSTPPMTRAWSCAEAGFLACHQDLLNVELHLLTTPLGLWASLALLAGLHPVLPSAVALLYGISLLPVLPRGLWLATAAAAAALTAAATRLPLAPAPALGLVALALVGQEAAHLWTGERTWQSTYQRGPRALQALLAHTFLLLPLVLRAAARPELPVLRHLVPRDTVCRARLDSPAEQADIDRLAAHLLALPLADGHTTHLWRDDLPPELRDAFDRLAGAPALVRALAAAHGPRARVRRVPEMDEVYVTAPEGGLSSDQVFYRSHVDGPFGLSPFSALHRGMIGITPNPLVETRFPLGGPTPATAACARVDRGDVLSFDFHREPHLITRAPGRAPLPRINLKVHHVVHPRGFGAWAGLLARLSVAYNRRARALFVDTLQPATPAARRQARLVLATTALTDLVHHRLGPANLGWTAAAAALGAWTGEVGVYLLLVSFVHYLLYIAVYANPDGVSWGRFVRDALFFKTVSLGSLAGVALAGGPPTPLALGLIGLGAGVSGLAAWRLGPERTFFGVELGHLPPARVSGFPYSLIPHPMIGGAVLALLGAHALPGLQAAAPWLVPAHIGLYLVHLLQEAAGAPRPQPVPPPAR
jgi:hypothetical protein